VDFWARNWLISISNLGALQGSVLGFTAERFWATARHDKGEKNNE